MTLDRIGLDELCDFLRAGGKFTLEEWVHLPAPIRTLAVEAAYRVRAEMAADIGLASQTEVGAAAVLARADGGDALASVALQDAARSALVKLRMGAAS